MRMSMAAATFAGAYMATPVLADGGLPIRPGMTLAQIDERLKPTCLEYFVRGTSTRYVTCIRGEGRTPEVVTAKVNERDETVYIQWRNLIGPLPPPDHAAATAKSLGFTVDRSPCTIFQEQVPCWADADDNKIHDGGYELDSGIHVFYLKRDGLE